MTAMPVLLVILSLMAIAYRYYSAFLAAKVAALDDSRVTPAERFNDGQNFHPTNKWVLFGHHFAAISGAGPLIGPVLAAQFGYMPGLVWIVVGVCLAGAAQDFMVLAMSTRRNGRSLAQIAYTDLGKVAGTAATAAILFILIIALGGLGKVVVKALGGEEVKYGGSTLILPAATVLDNAGETDGQYSYMVPAGSSLKWSGGTMVVKEKYVIASAKPLAVAADQSVLLPADAVRKVPGSAWGTFTIAATIPIALFVGLYMYKLRPGRVVEASLIGGAMTIGATVAGHWVANHEIGQYFNLSASGVTWSMAIYGFVAAVLPVWVLLAPRDYLSSFLKIGTIALLVVGVLVANPKLEAPALNHTFLSGGPIVKGTIFPFLFITIMCGAISGFHALVSSGTTPKMVQKESQTRMIGYGAMLIEGLVAVIALIAAASLSSSDYYAMNTELSEVPKYHDRILQVGGAHGVEEIGRYEELTQEALRGRTGGAVTLAVGMAHIFEQATKAFGTASQHVLDDLWKYWFHFAIMFEALFILTTIDAGTRIGRFLVQEALGKVSPKLGLSGGWLSGFLATGLVVCGWAWFLQSDSFSVIWKMFGIANQVLAVIALSVITAWLANEGRVKYIWVSVIPMLVIIITTTSSGAVMLSQLFTGIHTQINNPPADDRVKLILTYSFQALLILAMLGCAATVVISSLRRVMRVRAGEKFVIEVPGDTPAGVAH
ncbi:carbon starvation CstA family protein [Humisphaera borealis]|uniref:Carbon starvation protein A n=1 Tax=Humisphaera borealis TaxID=2807512 RepID=A0A7M2X3R9_9BACT|nr:carbon starvation protein A [Humisphaera borealis]QOV92279.1 carbon starvation protein A [Humisphaera borealis]